MKHLLWTAVAEDTKKQLLERTSGAKQSKTLNERVFVNGKHALGYTKGPKQHLVAATRQNTTDIQERMGLEIVQFIYYAYLQTNLSKSYTYAQIKAVFGEVDQLTFENYTNLTSISYNVGNYGLSFVANEAGAINSYANKTYKKYVIFY